MLSDIQSYKFIIDIYLKLINFVGVDSFDYVCGVASSCLVFSAPISLKIDKPHIDIEKIAFVLKNNAYGHGLIEMAKLANEHNIKHAVVINYNEAKEVAKLFDSILEIVRDMPSNAIDPL